MANDLAAGGIVSGTDTNAIMDYYRKSLNQPIQRMSKEQAQYSDEKGLYTDVDKLLTEMDSRLTDLSLSSGIRSRIIDPTTNGGGIVGMVPGPGTAIGSHVFEVEQLAKPATISSSISHYSFQQDSKLIGGIAWQGGNSRYNNVEGSHEITTGRLKGPVLSVDPYGTGIQGATRSSAIASLGIGQPIASSTTTNFFTGVVSSKATLSGKDVAYAHSVVTFNTPKSNLFVTNTSNPLAATSFSPEGVVMAAAVGSYNLSVDYNGHTYTANVNVNAGATVLGVGKVLTDDLNKQIKAVEGGKGPYIDFGTNIDDQKTGAISAQLYTFGKAPVANITGSFATATGLDSNTKSGNTNRMDLTIAMPVNRVTTPPGQTAPSPLARLSTAFQAANMQKSTDPVLNAGNPLLGYKVDSSISTLGKGYTTIKYETPFEAKDTFKLANGREANATYGGAPITGVIFNGEQKAIRDFSSSFSVTMDGKDYNLKVDFSAGTQIQRVYRAVEDQLNAIINNTKGTSNQKYIQFGSRYAGNGSWQSVFYDLQNAGIVPKIANNSDLGAALGFSASSQTIKTNTLENEVPKMDRQDFTKWLAGYPQQVQGSSTSQGGMGYPGATPWTTIGVTDVHFGHGVIAGQNFDQGVRINGKEIPTTETILEGVAFNINVNQANLFAQGGIDDIAIGTVKVGQTLSMSSGNGVKSQWTGGTRTIDMNPNAAKLGNKVLYQDDDGVPTIDLDGIMDQTPLEQLKSTAQKTADEYLTNNHLTKPLSAADQAKYDEIVNSWRYPTSLINAGGTGTASMQMINGMRYSGLELKVPFGETYNSWGTLKINGHTIDIPGGPKKDANGRLVVQKDANGNPVKRADGSPAYEMENPHSIAEVIGIINSSGAGVHIAYDKYNRRFTMESNDSSAPISLEGGTSKALDMLGLTAPTGGTYKAGSAAVKISEDTKLNNSSLFNTPFNKGVFTINDVQLYVDPENDTVGTLMDKVNSSGANVKLKFDESQQRFFLTNTNGDTYIKAGSIHDTSNFFEAANFGYRDIGRRTVSDGNGGFKTDVMNKVLLDNISSRGEPLRFKYTSPDLGTMEYERPTNRITDLIQGTTINIYKTGSATINVKVDTDKTLGKLADFVAAYNKLMDGMDNYDIKTKLDSLAKYKDELTDEKSFTMGAEATKDYNEKHRQYLMITTMQRNSDLGNIKNKLYSVLSGLYNFSKPANGEKPITGLKSIGLEFAGENESDMTTRMHTFSKHMIYKDITDRDKILEALKGDSTLITALEQRNDEVYNLFAHRSRVTTPVLNSQGVQVDTKTDIVNDGVAGRLKDYLKDLRDYSGPFRSYFKTGGTLDSRINAIKTQIEAKQKSVDSQLDGIWNRYSAMEQQVSQYQTQASQIQNLGK